MNRSYSKIRHIQESNLRLEKRFLNEEPGGESLSGGTRTSSVTAAQQSTNNSPKIIYIKVDGDVMMDLHSPEDKKQGSGCKYTGIVRGSNKTNNMFFKCRQENPEHPTIYQEDEYGNGGSYRYISKAAYELLKNDCECEGKYVATPSNKSQSYA